MARSPRQQLASFCATLLTPKVESFAISRTDGIWWAQVANPVAFESLREFARDKRGVDLRITMRSNTTIRIGVEQALGAATATEHIRHIAFEGTPSLPMGAPLLVVKHPEDMSEAELRDEEEHARLKLEKIDKWTRDVEAAQEKRISELTAAMTAADAEIRCARYTADSERRKKGEKEHDRLAYEIAREVRGGIQVDAVTTAQRSRVVMSQYAAHIASCLRRYNAVHTDATPEEIRSAFIDSYGRTHEPCPGVCDICGERARHTVVCQEGCMGRICVGCAHGCWAVPTSGFVKLEPACPLCRRAQSERLLADFDPRLAEWVARMKRQFPRADSGTEYYVVCRMPRCVNIVGLPRVCGTDAPVPACDECAAKFPEARGLHRCGVCGEGYFHISGCNVVHCSNCGCYTCLLCDSELDGHDITHFLDSSYYGSRCTRKPTGGGGFGHKSADDVAYAVEKQRMWRLTWAGSYSR